MPELLSSPEAWIALLSLTALEIVLGIDNIVFIAVITDRLPDTQKSFAYRVGLAGAMGTRIALLFALSWVMGLTAPLFTALGEEISGRDMLLLAGGLFLMAKSAQEIYTKVELRDAEARAGGKASNLVAVIVQIMVLDVVFSLDSVITAVGMVDEVAIMVVAIVIAILIMMVFAERVGDFVNRHPSMKLLALAFLLLIGLLLVAEGLDQHLDKRYIYFAMGFALTIELLNMRFRKKARVQSTTAEAGGGS